MGPLGVFLFLCVCKCLEEELMCAQVCHSIVTFSTVQNGTSAATAKCENVKSVAYTRDSGNCLLNHSIVVRLICRENN